MNDTKVLAVVGEKEITNQDLELLFKSLDPQTSQQFNSEEGKKQLLQELVNQELFYLDAIDKGLDKSPEYKSEVERAKANILKQYAVYF